MHDDRISAESVSVRIRVSVEDVFNVVWGDICLVLPSFDKHLEFSSELFYITVFSVKDYLVSSCCYLEFGEVAAQSLKIPVAWSVDFDRIDCFKLD